METLKSLLCHENWYWDSDNDSYIRFFEDRTGQAIVRRELVIFIAAHLTWEPRSPYILNYGINAVVESQTHERDLLGTFELDIMLSKSRVQDAGAVDKNLYRINECVLAEEAFSNNKFTMKLERGKFMTVDDAKVIDELPCLCYFSYRLLFEPSLLPAEHLWKKEAGRAPERLRFWEWKQFLAGRLPVEKKSSRANCILIL